MKKLLSFIIALSCMVVFCLPASEIFALEGNLKTVKTEFFDDFEADTLGGNYDTIKNWESIGSTNNVTSILEENGNKFMRIATNDPAPALVNSPVMATKDGLVNIMLKDATENIVIEADVRYSPMIANERNCMYLNYPLGATDVMQNYIAGFRNHGGKDKYLYPLLSEYPDDFDFFEAPELGSDKWFNIKITITPNGNIKTLLKEKETDKIVGNFESNTMQNRSFRNDSFITDLAFCVSFAGSGSYMDVDNVGISNEAPPIQEFADDFEADTLGGNYDSIKNWKSIGSTNNVTSIIEENGNKFMRIKTNDSAPALVSSPVMATKDGLVNIALKDATENILIEADVRYSPMIANERNCMYLNYPAEIQDVMQNYIAGFRNHGGKDKYLYPLLSQYPDDFDFYSAPEIISDKWFNIKVYMRPDGTIRTILRDKDSDKVVGDFDGKTMQNRSFKDDAFIKDIAFSVSFAEAGSYMDVDNIGIRNEDCALEEKPIKEFADDFEADTLGGNYDSIKNWESIGSTNNVTSIIEENGNKFMRIKTNDPAPALVSSPVMATKEGLVNIALKDATETIVIESDVRYSPMIADERNCMYLNYPVGIQNVMQNYIAGFRNHDGKDKYLYPLLTEYPDDFDFYSAPEIVPDKWFNIKVYMRKDGAIRTILREKSTGKVIGDFEGKTMQNRSFKDDAFITDIAFSVSFAEAGSYMDVDNVSIRNFKGEEDNLTVKPVFSKDVMENGEITVNASYKNRLNDAQIYAVAALYTKENGNLRLESLKICPATVKSLTEGSLTIGTFNITDSSNQVIKSFIWNMENGVNSMKPICESVQLG